jgi:hypothetical protein
VGYKSRSYGFILLLVYHASSCELLCLWWRAPPAFNALRTPRCYNSDEPAPIVSHFNTILSNFLQLSCQTH